MPEGQNRDAGGPTLAVVLGAGGLKCVSALCLLDAMDQAGIDIDFVIGCSGGALVAALHALGYAPEEAMRLFEEVAGPEIFAQVDYATLLGLVGVPGKRFGHDSSFLKPDRMRTALGSVFGSHRVEALEPPLRIQTTDIETGHGVLLDSGPLDEALFATSALIPFFPPVRVGERWLADGTFTAGLPVNEAVDGGADVIVAVSFSQEGEREADEFLTWYHHFFSRAAVLAERMEMAQAVQRHHHEIVAVNVHFPRPIELWHVHELPYILEHGRAVAETRLPEIQACVARFGRGR